jgi:HSP90 family molecular chaperone
MKRSEVDNIVKWVKKIIDGKVKNVRVKKRLDDNKCVVKVEEMEEERKLISNK